jgi:hypothetical protein
MRSDSCSSCGDLHGSESASGDASGTNDSQQECVWDNKEAWLHQAAPFDLSLMNDDLLEFTVSTTSNTTVNSIVNFPVN